jgi:hypothetical protein
MDESRAVPRGRVPESGPERKLSKRRSFGIFGKGGDPIETPMVSPEFKEAKGPVHSGWSWITAGFSRSSICSPEKSLPS